MAFDKCPSRTDGVHDFTHSLTCACGLVFYVPPISLSIEVFNGNKELVNEVFNCTSLALAVEALRRAADTLDEMM